MEPNRPRSREKKATGSGTVKRRGQGLGTGPVGTGSSAPRPAARPSARPAAGGGTTRSGGKKTSLIAIILALLLGGGGGLGVLLGGGGTEEMPQYVQPTQSVQQSQGSQSSPVTLDPSIFLSSLGGGSVSSGWELKANTGELDRTVASGARDKRTVIRGNGKDTVTIMVYMCGTDLESRSGMGTADLQEMLNAKTGDKINLLVYTGGCKGWRNNVVSSKNNQIYQIRDGQMACLVENAGNAAMTDPDNLASFIQWCAQNFPADRNQLIFWDHGGGSLSGYGYDEKYASSGSMDLAEIDKALKKGGVTFDFIGFDACLMATLETALTVGQYGDYLIASEETEPGVGWYYTDWLTKLSQNTSMPTIEIGKNIVDDFVDVCAQKCRGQSTTLSVVDLAELEATVPASFKNFAASTTKLIENKEYQTVSSARSGAREFAASTKIDQIDLVHLAANMETKEGQALCDALLGAVKYNRTSSNMTNAYGLSIYFPYQKANNVDQAVATYEMIGLDDEYARCIQEFASMEVSGQVSTGGTASPLPSLMGMLGSSGGASASSSNASAEMIGQLLGAFLQNGSGISGLTSGNMDFLLGRSLSTEDTAQYLAENRLDTDALVWQTNAEGDPVIALTEEQWSYVQGLDLNMFYDDGYGFIDLGLDNVFDFDANGALLGVTDGTWLAINGQPVAYYHTNTTDDGENYTISGYVPALLNGEQVELVLVFDNDNPYGYIAGARTVYADGETDTQAKGLTELAVGDTLDFICDYYGYDGSYQDSYFLGEQMTVTESMEISNVDIGSESVCATYRFTDLYNQHYWTAPMQ
ncbi:MAG: peptidase C11 [Clostridia bacterium]|nr:peptidase C11 [Clostridia bacterium]